MVATSKGEEACAEVSVFPSLCLDLQGMPHIAVDSWRVCLVLDFLLTIKKASQDFTSAETLPGKFFWGEASLLAKKGPQEWLSTCRSSSMHRGRSKIPLVHPTAVCCVSVF